MIKKSNEDKVLELLEDIKKLLVFALYKNKISTKEIGTVLRVSYKTIERIVVDKKIKA